MNKRLTKKYYKKGLAEIQEIKARSNRYLRIIALQEEEIKNLKNTKAILEKRLISEIKKANELSSCNGYWFEDRRKNQDYGGKSCLIAKKGVSVFDS